MHGQKIKFIRINNEYVLARRIALYTVIHHSNAGINRIKITSSYAARSVTMSINHITGGGGGLGSESAGTMRYWQLCGL